MTSIYFAKCDEYIKIGIASNVKQRIGTLQVGSVAPIELLGAVKGDGHDEQRLHKALRKHHHKGEWFKDCDEVREAIAQEIDSGDWSDSTVTRKASKETLGKVCKAIWPTKTAEHLAAAMGCSPRAAFNQLSGKHEPSARAIQAVINEIMRGVE